MPPPATRRSWRSTPRARARPPLPSATRGPTSSSALSHDLADVLEQGVAVDDRCGRALDEPLLAEDPLGIDEKERPVRGHRLLVEHPVGAHDLALREIAEERKRQLQGF